MSTSAASKTTPPLTAQAEETPIVRIDGTLSTVRRMVGRRVIGRLIVETVGIPLTQLDVIEAVRRSEREEESGEATVGAIANRLGIDPSRGSRLVAQMVEGGILRRDVSQADGRRAVVRLTDHSLDLLAQVRLAKRELIRRAVADWSDQEVETFAGMFEHFIDNLITRAEEGPAASQAERR